MAYFLIEYRYGDAEGRVRVRPEHLAYMTALAHSGSVLLGGPTVGDDCGAVLLDVADEAAAWQILTDDPYTREGVTADRTLREWNVVISSTEATS